MRQLMDRRLNEHRSLGAARMSASAFRYVLRPGRNGALRKLRRQALNALAQCGSSRRMHAADQFLRLRGGGRQQGGKHRGEEADGQRNRLHARASIMRLALSYDA